MPSSYQAPMRGDKTGASRTVSQSQQTNMASKTATVQDILDTKNHGVITISASDTLETAVGVLRDKRIGALIVTDNKGAVVGILSERDIVRKLAETPGQTLPQSVEANMTKSVVTCGPNDPLVSVLKQMSDGRFRHMPVVGGGQLLGMITIGDVVTFRLNELEHEALQLKQLIVG